MEEGQAIEHPLLSGAIRRAQKRVEGRNFEIRKRLLEYDLVLAKQREAIYSLRDRFLLPPQDKMETLSVADLDDYFEGLFEEYAENLLLQYANPSQPREDRDLAGLAHELSAFYPLPSKDLEGKTRDELQQTVTDYLHQALSHQKRRLQERFPLVARFLTLTTIDEAWLTHLYTLDDLKEGIGWTAYGGTDPLIAFRRESYVLFQEMLSRTAQKIVRSLLNPRLATGKREAPKASQRKLVYVHPSGDSVSTTAAQRSKQATSVQKKKIGRNAPCPCGSGKKYKNCCGRSS